MSRRKRRPLTPGPGDPGPEVADGGAPPARPSPGPETPALPRRTAWIWLLPLLVVVVAAGVYLNTLQAGFTFDDEWLVLTNRRLTEPGGRLDYIRYMLFDKTLWRPLKRISLMADYAIWGRKHPAGFHGTNIAIQTLVCLSLYFLVLRIGNNRRLAALTALLFAVHPVHVEGVANISHRKEPMSLLFYLLGFLAYLRARGDTTPSVSLGGLLRALGLARPPALGWITRIEFGLLTLVCYLCGMLSKEVGAVMLPATVLIYELVLAPSTRAQKARLLAYLSIPFVLVLGLFTWKGYLGSLPRRFNAEQIEWVTGGEASTYGPVFLTAVKAFGQYVAMLLWPHPLYLDRYFPVVKDPASLPVLLGFVLLAGFGVALLVSWRRSPLAFFALGWYGLNLLPVSGFIPLSHWLLAERFLYVPSVGFALLVALGLDRLWSGRLRFLAPGPSRALAAALSLAILAVHGVITVRQNRVWYKSESLWENTLRYNRKSYRAVYGYGLELDHDGKVEEAIRHYKESIELFPSYPEPHYALALLLLNQGDYAGAIREGEVHAKLARKDPETYMVIGNAWFNQRDYKKAAEAYRVALKRSPTHADATFNLANALTAGGEYAEALEVLDRAFQLKQETYDLLLLKGTALRALGRFEEALPVLERAAALKPRETEPLNIRADIFLSQRRFGEALAEIERSLSIDPDQSRLQRAAEQIRARLGATPPG